MAHLEKHLVVAAISTLAAVLLWLVMVATPPTSSQDYAAWAQVVGAMLAIVGSVYVGYLHADRQARIGEAERMKAAYLLARAAGTPVIEVDRWLRAGAEPDQTRVSRDWSRVRNYPEAWQAWISDRYNGYLEALGKVDIDTLADAAFLDNILSVRSRLKWLAEHVSPSVGREKLDKQVTQRLAWAARDVAMSLSEMRNRTDKALTAAGLPKITSLEAPAFPATQPSPHLKEVDRDQWPAWLAKS